MNGRLRTFGRGGLRVGPVGYGVAALGSLHRTLPESVWRGCVPAAWDAGIRYFDVAPHYGLGLAEQRLGRSLAAYQRDEIVVSTKVGRLVPALGSNGERDDKVFDVPTAHRPLRDYSRDGVLRSLEGSLERTGLDRIDILLVHDPDDHYRQALDGAFPVLEELRSQGVIRSYGAAGMNQSAMLAKIVRRTNLDVVMLAGRYTLLDQSALDDLLPAAVKRGVTVAVAGVFHSGVLAAPRPAASAHYRYAAAPPEIIERANRIADIAERYGTMLPVLAAQFPLAHPAVGTIVLGADTPARVARNAALVAEPVKPEVWAELKEVGLLRPDAPVPGGGVGEAPLD